MEVIDVLGKPCPIPVIEAKKALSKPDVCDVLVMVDNIVAVQNLEKMAGGYGYKIGHVEKSPNIYEVTISKSGALPDNTASQYAAETRAATAYNTGTSGNGDMAVVIGKSSMGDGSEELGKILIKGFIYSLTELETPPASVIFLNSGAFLTCEGSNTIDDLKKLEEKGVAVLTCGTCANYYELKDKLAVGSIANMYEITQAMALASSVVNL